jgi:hypothetical protein
MFAVLLQLFRKSKIKFCMEKDIGMIYIDMSGLTWWERAFKKKEFVLWENDIEEMRKFLIAYDSYAKYKSKK